MLGTSSKRGPPFSSRGSWSLCTPEVPSIPFSHYLVPRPWRDSTEDSPKAKSKHKASQFAVAQVAHSLTLWPPHLGRTISRDHSRLPIFRMQWEITWTFWNAFFFFKLHQEKISPHPATFLGFVSVSVFTWNDFLCTKWHFQFTKMYPFSSPTYLEVHSSLLTGTRISLSQSELPFSLKKWKIREEMNKAEVH